MAARLPFVVSAVFHYLGPAFAVLLFVRVDVLGVAWLRIAAAALVFALWRRPWHALKQPDRDRLGRRAGADELLLLPRDRPAAAGDRGRDRVPARDRARRARRPHEAQRGGARARRPRRLPAHRRAPRGRGRWASRWRSPTPACSRPTSCSRTGRGDPTIAGIDGLAGAMLIALVAVTPLAGWARRPRLRRPGRAGGGHRRRDLEQRDPLRRRPDRDGAADPRGLRADGLAAARDRDRRRPARAHPGPVSDRRRRHRAGHRGRGAPSRAHSSASRTTVAAPRPSPAATPIPAASGTRGHP